MNPWKRELEVAVEAAKRAGALALRYQHGIEAETKSDLSPVTRADREAEQLIAAMFQEAFPADGLLGEEGANREARSGRKWIIDPIDGTRDYVRGNPFWCTLLGLEEGGEVVAGVCSFPAQGLVYTAARGDGAYRNGERMEISRKIQKISDAAVCFNGFSKSTRVPFRAQLLDWLESTWSVRSYGGAPDAMMVAAGHADVWVETTAAPWDLAALKIILEEAGAVFFNFDGGDSIYGGNCIACVPALEEAMRALCGLSIQHAAAE